MMRVALNEKVELYYSPVLSHWLALADCILRRWTRVKNLLNNKQAKTTKKTEKHGSNEIAKIQTNTENYLFAL